MVLDSHVQKNKVGSLPTSQHLKNKTKMDQGINIRNKSTKLLEETLGWLWIWQYVLKYDIKS